MKIDFSSSLQQKDEDFVVVRVSTSYWSDENGMYTRKNLRYLKRKSRGFNVLAEDASQIGAEDTLTRINNLDTVEDGVYRVVVINERRDWETGQVEDWSYSLFPWSEDEAF